MTSLVMNHTEVRFFTAVTAAGGVNISSICVFIAKLLKSSEIKGVKIWPVNTAVHFFLTNLSLSLQLNIKNVSG